MEEIELGLLGLFRSRTTPADKELKREVEAQLSVAKQKYEEARAQGVDLPKIDWDVADSDVILRFQKGFDQLQEHLMYRKPKRRRTDDNY